MTKAAIDRLMRDGLRQRVFPGAVLLAATGDDPFFFEAYGQANLFAGQSMTRDTVFDLASLTKPLATTLAVARLADRGDIDLDRPVGNWLPLTEHPDHAAITPRQLLCHRSGLPAHRLYFMQLQHLAPSLRRSALTDLLVGTPLADGPGSRTRYSDLGFMLLCRLVEAVAACRLDHYLRSAVYAPLGISRDLFFVDLGCGSPPDRSYAATELCPVRHRLLIGEVHDDNAWFAGGVDGHAGLFGTAEAVFRLLRYLLAGLGAPGGARILSNRMRHEILFGNRAHPLPLGFDRPSGEHSSVGDRFSSDTVGHLGYTGVSFWVDLKKDVSVVLLTNRVHPCRWNDRLRPFRPAIHNRIMKSIENQPD
jgi:CubicO group peptidase (beta-lactamase class C family)